MVSNSKCDELSLNVLLRKDSEHLEVNKELGKELPTVEPFIEALGTLSYPIHRVIHQAVGANSSPAWLSF